MESQAIAGISGNKSTKPLAHSFPIAALYPLTMGLLLNSSPSPVCYTGDNNHRGKGNLSSTEVHLNLYFGLNISQLLETAVKDFFSLLFLSVMHSSSSPSPREGGKKSLDKSLAPGQENIQTAALHKSVTLIPLRTTANVKNGRVKQAQVLTPLFFYCGEKKKEKAFFL